MDINTRRYNDLLSAYQKAYFVVKSNYNLKEHKSCGKKSKMIQQNMKKQ